MSGIEQLEQRIVLLERRLGRYRRLGVIGVMIASGVALMALRAARPRPYFEELDVERLNIVEADGRLALVLANQKQLPPPIVDGKEVQTGRTGPGMLFFNGKGDECGGLVYGTAERGGRYEAGAHFSFDQYNNDQVLYLSYQDNGESRRSGLYVVDRPLKPTIQDMVKMRDALTHATGAEKAKLEKELQDMNANGALAAQRVFVGSDNGTAAIRLKDTTGRDRIRLSVSSANVAVIELLDANGQVVARWPEK